jgi:peptide/nickel transport system permease protein
MSEQTLTLPPKALPEEQAKRHPSALSRVLKYTLFRIATLFLTVVVGIYLTILIANMGGYVDQIQRAQVREDVQQLFLNNAAYKALDSTQRLALMDDMIRTRESSLGLDQPFALRSFRFLSNALTLNLGWAKNMASDSGSRQVRNIMLERLPPTLFLFASQYHPFLCQYWHRAIALAALWHSAR